MKTKALWANVLGLALCASACVGNTKVLGTDDETDGGDSATGGGAGAGAGGGSASKCGPDDCGAEPTGVSCDEGARLVTKCESDGKTCGWSVQCQDGTECNAKGGVCTLPSLVFPPNYTQIDAGCPGSADVCWVPIVDGSGDGGGGGSKGGDTGAGGSKGGDTGCVGLGGCSAEGEIEAAVGCGALEQTPNVKCFTLEELNDVASGTHLRSIDSSTIFADGGVTGDGGTNLCPSADELLWLDHGGRCGCFDVPACEAPTTEQGGKCCYPANTLCRLC